MATRKKGRTPMNALQELIANYLADHPDETYASIARRGTTEAHFVRRQTIAALATREQVRQTPQPATLEALAQGMQVPLSVVTQAAAAAAFGYHGTFLSEIKDENIRTTVVGMAQLDPKRKAEIAARVRFLLAESRAESGSEEEPVE